MYLLPLAFILSLSSTWDLVIFYDQKTVKNDQFYWTLKDLAAFKFTLLEFSCQVKVFSLNYLW